MNSVKHYAGFWKRFVAYLVDEILLSIAGFFIFLPVLLIAGMFFFDEGRFGNYRYSALNIPDELQEIFSGGELYLIIFAFALYIITVSLVKWLYYAIMESSSRQATIGKMILGLKVVDVNGNRISFLRATGRYFGKIISSLVFCIGYIIIAFTEKKQALHDMIAGCLIYDETKTSYMENYSNRDKI